MMSALILLNDQRLPSWKIIPYEKLYYYSLPSLLADFQMAALDTTFEN